MSYCRWSSDDFQCDLYCYADVHGGYTTHVARNRLVPREPLPPKVEFSKKARMARYTKVNKILEKARRVNIKLPHVGETFNDETLEGFLKRVIYLKCIGYRAPDYLVDRIVEEIKEKEMVATVKAIMRTRAGKYKTAEYKQGWTHGRDAAITAAMKRKGR